LITNGYVRMSCKTMEERITLACIICLLLTLYVLQGVIIGIILAIPLYLDSRDARWKEQATFNFVVYPFSLKLLWAPVLDVVYVARWGRRKTWLIPIQLLLATTLILLSFRLSTWIEQVQIKWLTWSFFFVYFLLASQDICVDGWALTCLAKYNLQWASTCQTVGQTIGRFIGFTILMAFESAELSNRFLRKPLSLKETPDGLFTLDQFVRFWAFPFLFTAIWIVLVRSDDENETAPRLNLIQTYLSIVHLSKKTCIRQLACLILISPIGYAATYAMTNLTLKR
jgi:MFS transporter, PAT family, solute carrier family 33 (acetyl-CoA transportor), member 1